MTRTVCFWKHQSKESAPVKKKKRDEAMTFKVIHYLQKWIQMYCESWWRNICVDIYSPSCCGKVPDNPISRHGALPEISEGGGGTNEYHLTRVLWKYIWTFCLHCCLTPDRGQTLFIITALRPVIKEFSQWAIQVIITIRIIIIIMCL